MSDRDCILAIDQGTTSSRAIVFDGEGRIISTAQAEFAQIFPDDGWVEHDPEAIWSTTLSTAQQAFTEAEELGHTVAGIGITNQRETTIIWERASGQPIHNAIVWQDRRTARTCEQLVQQGLAADVQARTGLLIDPYFSATKIAWLLDHVDGARGRAAELAFGTVDCFLLWRLTGGASHATDATNASRTSLFNIHEQQWDDELLTRFGVPPEVLPDVLDCNAHFGDTLPELFGRSLPVLGIAGDQQAAAIGQCCFAPGSIKSTYGTGCFVILNTGDRVIESRNRLLSTVASRLDGNVTYGLEGSIFMAGAAVQWLRDGLGIIASAKETETLVGEADEHSAVYLVPAFTGLGAPHWKPDARGAIFGLTRASGPAEVVRATLESVAYQTHDLLTAMNDDGARPESLRVDGGMVANDWFAQCLADVLAMPIERPRILETTAWGAALLAGQSAGVYADWDRIAADWQLERRFDPGLSDRERERRLAGWHDAVARIVR